MGYVFQPFSSVFYFFRLCSQFEDLRDSHIVQEFERKIFGQYSNPEERSFVLTISFIYFNLLHEIISI